MEATTLFPAEWYPQSAVQLTWPHEGTDWVNLLDEVIPCFVSISREISKRQKLIIVCPDQISVREQLGHDINIDNISFYEIASNDTWARDHAAISILEQGVPMICDFCFNGWGLKYPANEDNLITQALYTSGAFREDVQLLNMRYFVLEGGSLESDGQGTLLTTSECLLSPNRNDGLQKEMIERVLIETFGLKRILWLNSGYLAGDDTDSHIDTLARFCSEDTISYVKCDDTEDEHYAELKDMEEELSSFTRLNGEPYRLLPLPVADPVEWEGERLPATYANFLIINNAVLLPFYGSPKDEQAKAVLQQAFPDREIIGINCLPLIKQHGSLHCVTMQYPEGFI